MPSQFPRSSDPTSDVTRSWRLLAASMFAFILFVAWVQFSPQTLGALSAEDGPIENVSALLFFIGSVGFIVGAARSKYLGSQGTRWAYLMILGWAGIGIICGGEEISWGQRLLGFETPPKLEAINAQQEFNFHNLHAFATIGGTYRFLSLFVLTTGLVIPAMAMTAWGRKLFRQFSFPVVPLAIAPAFVGAYVFGWYYIEFAPVIDIKPPNAINEVREFMIGYAMAAFGLAAALIPDRLFPPATRTSRAS